MIKFQDLLSEYNKLLLIEILLYFYHNWLVKIFLNIWFQKA